MTHCGSKIGSKCSFMLTLNRQTKAYKIIYLYKTIARFKLKFLATTETTAKHYREARLYETSQTENTETITQAIYDVPASEL